MKVGILNAIDPNKSTVNWGGSPIDAYIRFFKGLGAPFDFTGYEAALGVLPDSADECDAYIITGSMQGAYDADPWIADLAVFIRQAYAAGQRLVGICFGHQILAQALGGRVEKSKKGIGFGVKRFDLYERKTWMQGEMEGCGLYFAHQDQVLDLPPEAELLGGNDFCPNTMFAIGDRVLGIQGHPEFTAGIMDDIRVWAQAEMPPEAYAVAAGSLENAQPDGKLVGKWIINFLEN